MQGLRRDDGVLDNPRAAEGHPHESDAEADVDCDLAFRDVPARSKVQEDALCALSQNSLIVVKRSPA